MAGRSRAPITRQIFDREKVSRLPEHRAEHLAAISGTRGKRYLKRQHLFETGEAAVLFITELVHRRAAAWVRDVDACTTCCSATAPTRCSGRFAPRSTSGASTSATWCRSWPRRRTRRDTSSQGGGMSIDILSFDPETLDLEPLLKRLHLANARRTWRDLCARAEEESWSPRRLLATLFAEEVARRRQTRLQREVRRAHFPFFATVEDFDFTMQSTLRLALLGSYLGPELVSEGRCLVLQGKTGRGKTHLAVGIAYRAIQNGFTAYCEQPRPNMRGSTGPGRGDHDRQGHGGRASQGAAPGRGARSQGEAVGGSPRASLSPNPSPPADWQTTSLPPAEIDSPACAGARHAPWTGPGCVEAHHRPSDSQPQRGGGEADLYALRWRIETYFKVLKSGCKAESLRLRTAERLTCVIAVFCILAWRAFWMTMVSREDPKAPAGLVFTDMEQRLLDRLVSRPKIPPGPPPLSPYIVKLAKLGGYLARTRDGPPGNTVIWRGLARLTDIELGFALGSELMGN